MKRGFTLIELIVVVAIIALLTGIVLTALSGSRAKARDGQRISDVSQLQGTLELYFDRCGQYPNSLSTDANNGCPSATPPITLGTFISQIPTPPGGGSYDYATLSTSGGPLANYVLHTTLESAGNAAMPKSLTVMPTTPDGYFWSASFTCSGSSPVDYCATSN